MSWYLEALRKYADFSGRSRRKEYWLFTLFNAIITMVVMFIDTQADLHGMLYAVYSLGVFIPSLAVTVRRLHDTDHRGWWLLIAFVPLIGFLVLLYFLVIDGDPGKNRFGPNPKKVKKVAAPSGLEDPALL